MGSRAFIFLSQYARDKVKQARRTDQHSVLGPRLLSWLVNLLLSTQAAQVLAILQPPVPACVLLRSLRAGTGLCA